MIYKCDRLNREKSSNIDIVLMWCKAQHQISMEQFYVFMVNSFWDSANNVLGCLRESTHLHLLWQCQMIVQAFKHHMNERQSCLKALKQCGLNWILPPWRWRAEALLSFLAKSGQSEGNWWGSGEWGWQTPKTVVNYCCFVLPRVLLETFLSFPLTAGDDLGFQPTAAGNGTSRAIAFLPFLLPALSPNCFITCCFWLFCHSILLPWLTPHRAADSAQEVQHRSGCYSN